MAAAAAASAVQVPPDSPSPHPSDASGSDDAGRRPSVGELGFMDVGDLGDSQFQGYFGGKEFDDLDFGDGGGGGSAASAGGGMGLRSRSFDGLANMLTGVLKDEADAVRRSVRAAIGVMRAHACAPAVHGLHVWAVAVVATAPWHPGIRD